MKINGGKIHYISGKLLSTVLSVTLVMSSAGCTNYAACDIKCNIEDSADYVFQKKVTYEELKDYFLIEIMNSDENKVYLARRYKNKLEYNSSEFYLNVFDNEQIFNETKTRNKYIKQKISFEEYINDNNMAKNEYSEEEIKVMFDYMKQDYFSAKQNILVKK